jgi:predicted Fe-Mo cluster-binding NifX family protein
MSIIITARGAGKGAWVDEDFSHARQVVVVEQGSFRAWENPFRESGDGVGLARRMLEDVDDIEGVVTARIDADARRVFRDRGVAVFLTDGGAVLDLVEAVGKHALTRA